QTAVHQHQVQTFSCCRQKLQKPDGCFLLFTTSRHFSWVTVFPVKMDLWSLKLHLAIWTLLSRPGVFSLEVSVRHSELKPCEGNDRVCVTDSQDCQHPPPSSLRKTLNMSCYYQETSDQHRSVTCSWSQVSESKASLVFTSDYKIFSCSGIFNPAATLEVTARIKSYLTGRDVWSQPHRMFLFDKVKPSQPALALIASTADSLVASWKSNVHGSCRLRYRPNDAHTWTEVSDLVPAYEGQTLNYTITNLLPFMAYTAAVACTTESGIWSDWSSDTTIQTLDRGKPSRHTHKSYTWPGSVSTCDTFLERSIVRASAGNNLMLTLYR
ncbi:hypothetical protein AMECASPLE_033669, partial [Ameca splendens]